jgi:hypothetical protein
MADKVAQREMRVSAEAEQLLVLVMRKMQTFRSLFRGKCTDMEFSGRAEHNIFICESSFQPAIFLSPSQRHYSRFLILCDTQFL